MRSTSSGGAGAVAVRQRRSDERSAVATAGCSTTLAHCVGTAPTTVMRSASRRWIISSTDHGCGLMTTVIPHASCSHSLAMYPACANGVATSRRSNGAAMTPAVATAASIPRWSNQAPFGNPVVPLVQMMTTGSSGDRRGRRSPRPAPGVAHERLADHDRWLRSLHDRVDLARAEPRIEARGDRTGPDDRGVGDGVVERRWQRDGDDVAWSDARVHEVGGSGVRRLDPLGEGAPPITVDVGLAVAELVGRRVHRLVDGREATSQRRRRSRRHPRPRIMVPLEQNQPPVPLTQASSASGTWRDPQSPRS